MVKGLWMLFKASLKLMEKQRSPKNEDKENKQPTPILKEHL
jgi:hypothetical protein